MTHFVRINQIVVLICVFLISCNGINTEKTTGNSATEPEYLIAYNVLVDGESDDYDIFTMKFDGSEKTNITGNPDIAWTYLAIHDKIMFLSDRDTARRNFFLYEMDPDGSNIKKVNDFMLSDSWMGFRKNGEEIIVVPYVKTDSLFYIINRQGSILKKIATGLVYSADPAFSPDGSQIVFRGANKKSKREDNFEDALYIIRDDGTNLLKLTQYPESDTTAPWYAYKAGPPQWHPTQNFISYASFRNGKYRLFAVSPEGRDLGQLIQVEFSVTYHCWSSDGKWLALSLSDVAETQFNIGLMDWETKELKVLTDSVYNYQMAPVIVEAD